MDDIVQGVICSISKDEERIAISFRSSKLPSEYGDIELGVIEDLEEKNLRAKSFDDMEYNEHLRKDPGFSNPTNVQTLLDILGIDSRPPNSLLRLCQRWKFIDNEAESLRKQQSKKWSMETTATGVESFKNGDHEKALKYFNHALKIYEENCEALVARGALYANQNKLEYAIKNFKEALKLYPKHHNARKYLIETLFEKATRLKDVGNIKDAIGVFEEVLELDPRSTESQEHLNELKSTLAAKLAEEESRAPQSCKFATRRSKI
ncbi:tetratricopeptide repeat protein 14-like [Dendronephthya gigantea]|uniref:tetratricopeptide repeat protein 14-like n=1 Tax=Dendronephthya gigantea TaxID=151771 RepID=UPI00106AE6A5|nr:tetratricopeptide repeat protein 14-like [Dendronephthya gigantea]